LLDWVRDTIVVPRIIHATLVQMKMKVSAAIWRIN
jgi:hypothetical protein